MHDCYFFLFVYGYVVLKSDGERTVQGKEKTQNGDQITSYTIIYKSKEVLFYISARQ